MAVVTTATQGNPSQFGAPWQCFLIPKDDLHRAANICGISIGEALMFAFMVEKTNSATQGLHVFRQYRSGESRQLVQLWNESLERASQEHKAFHVMKAYGGLGSPQQFMNEMQRQWLEHAQTRDALAQQDRIKATKQARASMWDAQRKALTDRMKGIWR